MSAEAMNQAEATTEAGAIVGMVGRFPGAHSLGEHWAHEPSCGIDCNASTQLTEAQRRHLAALIGRYTRSTAESKRLTAENRAHLADPCAIAGFHREWKEMAYPIIAERSEGSRIWDIDGSEYIDFSNDSGQILLGHRPAFLVEAVERQLHRGIESGPMSPLAGKVSQQLSRMTGMARVAFCNTSNEAIAAALRIARTVTSRDKIVVFSDAYGGVLGEALSRSAMKAGQPAATPLSAGIPHSAQASLVSLEYGSQAALDWIRANAHQLAAVLVDAAQSDHSELQPREFLHAIRAITEASGAALILDENITGFRIALGGAQEHFQVRADMVAYGKIVGGGMPIGVLAGGTKFMDVLDGGSWSFGDDSSPKIATASLASTCVRHPLSLAAASAVLDYIEEQGPALQKRLAQRTADLAAQMNGTLARCRLPFRWEAVSSLLSLRLPPELHYASLLYYHMRMRGVLIWESHPSFLTTAHSEDDARQIAGAFEESIHTLMQAGFLEKKSPAFTSPATLTKSSHTSATTEQAKRPPSSPATREDRFPVTESQSELLVCAALGDEANAAFNEPIALSLNGPLDYSTLLAAMDFMIERHSALRTTFDSATMEQIVHPTSNIKLRIEDLSALDAENQAERLDRLVRNDAQTAMPLHRGPLIRMLLCKLDDNQHELLATAHHIARDGWSASIFCEELAAIYTAMRRGEPIALPPAGTMSAYAAAETVRRNTPEQKATDDWWLAELREPPPAIQLPEDHIRGKRRSFLAGTRTIFLNPSMYSRIREFASAERSTVFACLYSAYATLLHRLTTSDDFAIGIASAGQQRFDGGPLIGHCVNFLPVRNSIPPAASFREFLKSSASKLLAVAKHNDFTLGRLLTKLGMPRDIGPLTTVTFNMSRDPQPLDFAGTKGEIELDSKTNHPHELSFDCVEQEGGCLILCHFSRQLFLADTVDRWLRHFQTILEHITVNPSLPLGDIPLISPQERTTILKEWNRTAREYKRTKSISELFEEQVRHAPRATAITTLEGKISYAELNTAANRMAHRLIAGGLQPGSYVGICAARSQDAITATLAVLKAGCAYLPIDPAWPTERLAFISRDAPLLAVVTTSSESHRFHDVSQILLLDAARPKGGADKDQNPLIPTSGELPAYVMYTSGSTGVPKGVVIPHRAVTRLVTNTNYVLLGAEDVVAHGSNPAFDAATFEIWGALLNGGRIAILAEDSMRSPEGLASAIARFRITTMFLATPLFNEIAIQAPEILKPLKHLLFGGEVCSPRCISRVIAAGPPSRLLHVYGPTESTTFTTSFLVTHIDSSGPTVPIGYPISNTETYVLDSRLHPVPVGVAGELYIGGDGLAIGYLNRPELTAERFIPNPFATASDAKLYRTGDAVCLLPDGAIQFLGRLDGQVKVRGFRIELGEVEAEILRQPGIKAAAVKVVEIEDKRHLSAYFVADSATGPDCDVIRTRLGKVLPGYMVPTFFKAIAAIPLTRNGKVDRAALPMPMKAPAELPHDETPTSLLVTIQAGFAQETPIFIVPGGLGGASEFLPYAGMARHLGPEFPVFGLRARGAESSEPPYASVVEMAADFVCEIRTKQPRGPYRIIGENVGGICAHEIAHQLTKAGEKVDLLALLSTPTPTRENLRNFKRQQFLNHSESHYQSTFLGRFRHHLHSIQGYSLMEKIRYLAGKSSERTNDTSHHLESPSVPRDYPLAMFKHRLQPYPSKITLIIDAISHKENGDIGWKNAHTGELEIHIIPGDQSTFIREHGEIAAHKILETLNRITKAQTV